MNAFINILTTALSFLANFYTVILIPFVLFAIFIPKRKFWWISLIVAIGADIAFFCIPKFYSQGGFMVLFGWLNMAFIVVFILLCLLFYLSVKVKVRHVLFFGSAVFAIQNITHNVSLIISDFFETTPYKDLSWYIISLIVVTIFYVGFYFVAVRRVKYEDNKAMDNVWLIVLSVTTILITNFLSLFFLPTNSENNIGRFYAALSCLFLLFLQFSVFDKSKVEEEKAIAEQMVLQSQKQFDLYKENVEVINVKCHDLRHQLKVLRHAEGEVDKQSLKEIEKAINIYDNVAKTENPTLDIIVTEYCLSAEKNNIRFTYLADGKKLSFLSESDITSIFGNALENAFESVMKLSDPEKRIVSMNIYETGNMLNIHIDNYHDGNVKIVNGLPITSKGDLNYHGYGVRSIQMAVEKNNGQMVISVTPDLFNIDIMFIAM